MRFDTILVGGGLSSLVCGIRLQKKGLKCLIVSAGQNALYFSSGSFDLLGRLPDGTSVSDPLESMQFLGVNHPYSKIGRERISGYLDEVIPFFSECGIALHALPDVRHNHFRFTPSGSFKTSWLSLNETSMFPEKDSRIEGKALIVNFAGFLDFNTAFIAEGLERRGATCRVEVVRHPEIERLRANPTEMRSINIARVMDISGNWKEVVSMIKELLHGEDYVVLPEVFGLLNPSVSQWIREMIPAQVIFVGTMPPSVPGLRTHILLKKRFEELGGTFLPGDEAKDPVFDGDRLSFIRTANLGTLKLEADNFVTASGNLFGNGLASTPEKIVEPVFGLDVEYPSDRSQWFSYRFSDTQNYMSFGVTTDRDFHPCRNGITVPNMYVAGAELGGCNSLAEGSGAGIAIMTAFCVADQIKD